MIDGILPVDKAQGWTSHDVVARVRRLAGQRQVGHAGTLDPLATGLLLVVLGHATKLSSVLMESPKTYLGEVVLGATTVTDDAEGPLLERHDVSGVSHADVEDALRDFVGNIEQRPPAYAAVKVNGRKLYQLARRGETVKAPSRRVAVHAIDLHYWRPPRLGLRIECGSGTYIRSIARDLGVRLGTGGYLHALRRVRSGYFAVTEAASLEQLVRDGVNRYVAPPDRALAGWPAIIVTDDEAVKVRDGRSLACPATVGMDARVYAQSGNLLALAHIDNGIARPYRVFRSEADAIGR